MENGFCGNDADDNDDDDDDGFGNCGLNFLKLMDQIIYIKNFRLSVINCMSVFLSAVL
jgi:hypothetical protein